MSEKVSFIDRPYSKWALAIVSILGFGWGLFQTFHTKAPKLKYEIVSQVSLFNKTNELSSVKLLVDTVDVLREDRNISLYVLKIQNVGSNHLRSSDYDDGIFGITVGNGDIIQDPSFEDSSNPHIQERFLSLSPSSSKHFVDIPHISLDRGDWYTIAFSIIHSSSILPNFCPVGKIVGQKNIEVVSVNEEEEKPFWVSVFDGGFWINTTRFFLSILFLFLIAFLVAFSISSISESVENKRESRAVHQIISNPKINPIIRDDYLKREHSRLHAAMEYLGRSDMELNDLYHNAQSFIRNPANVFKEEFDDNREICSDIEMLVSNQYLIKDGNDNLSIPAGIKSSMAQVKKILESNKINSIWRFYYSSEYKQIEKEMMNKNADA